jgi:murein DD-endopeptidase MepM/ murein hydrolase activator NlpD
MSKGQFYYYDEAQCTFVEAGKPRAAWLKISLTTLAIAVVLAAGMYWGMGTVWGSPEVMALEADNDQLRLQLSTTDGRIEMLRADLESLAKVDQQLYRTILEAEPIPEEVRQAGVGGTDIYEEFQRFAPDTRSVLRATAENLDRLEREAELQSSSYRELVELARVREEELRELPSIMPSEGRVVSGYGMRMHPIDRVRRMHYGIDITTPKGTPVIATADGVVKSTGRKGGYGITVDVKHTKSGYVTRYTHLSKIPKTTRRGHKVKRGDLIAYSGSTGRTTAPHVHYEILDASGRRANPIDFFAPGMTPSEYERLKSEAEAAVVSLD